MKKIEEYKKQVEVPKDERIDFDSLPYEERKRIIEELEKENAYYAKMIDQSKNENN